jgi:hypothetical protein
MLGQLYFFKCQFAISLVVLLIREHRGTNWCPYLMHINRGGVELGARLYNPCPDWSGCIGDCDERIKQRVGLDLRGGLYVRTVISF